MGVLIGAGGVPVEYDSLVAQHARDAQAAVDAVVARHREELSVVVDE